MKVLVIGGTKFIGPYLVRNLLELGHEVMVFHRGDSNNHLANVAEILGDRCNLSQFINQFKIFNPDIVVDMIPSIEKDANDVIEVFRGIAKRVIAISSGDVYFSYDVIIKNETGPIDNSHVSEKSKLRNNLFPYRNKGNPNYDKNPDGNSYFKQ